jgi:hypothetical protein
MWRNKGKTTTYSFWTADVLGKSVSMMGWKLKWEFFEIFLQYLRGWDLAELGERLTANTEVATVLGSIQSILRHSGI